MHITEKTKKIVRQYAGKIAAMTGWTTLPVILSAVKMSAWSLLLWVLIDGEKSTNLRLQIALIVITTAAQRWAEHTLVRRKAQYGNAFKGALRAELFEKLFFLGPAFIERKQHGELITTLWEKVEWINYYLFYYRPTSWMILLFSGLCAAAWMSIRMEISVLIFLSGILVIAVPPLFYRILKKSGENEWRDNDAFYSACLDGLQGIITLKAFNAGDNHRRKINDLSEKNRQSIMSNLLLTTLNTRVIELLISGGGLAVAAAGAWALMHRDMKPYQLLFLFLLMQAWADGARQMFGAWLRGNKGLAAFESVAEILNEKSDYSLIPVQDCVLEDAAIVSESSGIAFDHVTFSYQEPEKPSLQNVSLAVRPGTHTALVGSSGSGKSTVVRLLFGFYRPQVGTVAIDGRILDAQTVLSAQQRITVIWQDCHIFYMSCLDNIRIARPDATLEEVYAAARKANIHETISRLPQGYDTLIGDGGRAFSGGEKQRIGLARAFLRDTPILILDEATSSLDRKNEKEIQRGIQSLSKGKTVLAIAHRLDTIQDSDQICVMEAGQIVERGTHEELLACGDRYRKLMGTGAIRKATDNEV